MKKILVTTDFSPAAQNAVNLAAHIANKLGCTLSLFHCYNIPVPVGDMPFPPVPVSEIEEQIALAFKKQASLVHSQFPNMVVETGCQAGLASEDIIKVANSDNDI